MNPANEIHGAEPRRFLRFVCEFEVEVTDPIKAAEYTWDLGHDESGELGMVPYSNQNEQIPSDRQWNRSSEAGRP